MLRDKANGSTIRCDFSPTLDGFDAYRSPTRQVCRHFACIRRKRVAVARYNAAMLPAAKVRVLSFVAACSGALGVLCLVVAFSFWQSARVTAVLATPIL